MFQRAMYRTRKVRSKSARRWASEAVYKGRLARRRRTNDEGLSAPSFVLRLSSFVSTQSFSNSFSVPLMCRSAQAGGDFLHKQPQRLVVERCALHQEKHV